MMKTKRYIVISIVILGFQTLYSQTISKNYIQTYSVQAKDVKTEGSINTINSLESIMYIDGLGRNIQSVAVGITPNGGDQVQTIVYDQYGRQAKDYLPYTAATNGGLFRTDALSSTNSYYLTTVYENTSNPYSEKHFDGSPLNRVLEQTAPGNDWQKGAVIDANGHSNGHTVKLDYQTNIAGEVKLYFVTLDANYTPTLQNTTTYLAEELYKNITKDENWKTTDILNRTTEEFTNKQGQVVLKRTYNAGLKHDTYYVYDDFGNLSYVLPPKMEASTAIIDTINNQLNELGYQYKYDKRNRLIEKKIPGKGWEFIVYDKLDRPVLTQDSNLRVANKWLFTKYDVFGRVAYTGFFTINSTRPTLQSIFDNKSVAQNYEEKVTSGTGYDETYYTNADYPNEGIEILTVNYYDDYSFAILEGTNPGSVYDEVITTRTKGLATGSKVKVLGTSNWITTVMYYDQKALPIYVYNYNDYLKTTETIKSDLDFVGKLLETTSTHKKDAGAIISTKDSYYYDYAGRLLTRKQKINTQAEEVIVQNSYDELGQLISKGIGGTTTQARLQNIDYTYNIRGWLKGINDVNNLGTDLFGFAISYNQPKDDVYGQVMPQFNGNISETFWKTANDNYLRGNGYRYDALNRLNDAWYEEPENPLFLSTGDRIKKYPGFYETRLIEYDKNGNINYLRRSGLGANNTSVIMDRLYYTYQANSNKLLSVAQGPDATQGGFTDGNTVGNDYSYDGNGNLKEDKNKGIADIIYNHLNLPSQITFASGKIEYFYDAIGTKQKKKVTNGAVITTTDYAGNYIYQNNALQMINQPEGYIEPNTAQTVFNYGYRLKDHLGNIRLTFVDFDHNGSIALSEITEENNYYPFGLKHQGYNFVVNSNVNAVATKFKYNGKELQDDDVNGNKLNLYDYGARMYDPALARWHVVDPLAERYLPFSTYNYTLNNPIRYIDPDGRWVKGAGFFRNIFKSDDRINAENEVAKIGGDAEAHRNEKSGGWNVTYTSGEKTDFGNGEVELRAFNIVNFSKKNRDVGSTGGGELTELSVGTERGIGLGGSVWGGAATMTYADEIVNGVSTTTKGMAYLRVGGNALGGLGFAATTYNNVVKIQNGTLNTAGVVDWGISGGMLLTGVLISNPVGLTVLAVGGIGYGVYRLAAGDATDAWINENFGFRP